jgi:hypothetical protein
MRVKILGSRGKDRGGLALVARNLSIDKNPMAIIYWKVETMFSTHQQELLNKLFALLLEGDQILNQARPLPIVSGVDELTTGLSTALAGLKMILNKH